MNILKNTLLGLFFGTFGTTLRRNYRSKIQKHIKKIPKLYPLIRIRTNDVNCMF